MKKTIDFITMGCSKNLVDTEILMNKFENKGYYCTHDSENPHGEIVVINTCGFIGDAKQESINTILEFAQAKDEGKIERLYVMGCLSQRYKGELEAEIPQVDKYYGKFDYTELLNELGDSDDETERIRRHITTPRHYAYLKISEGCDRRCAYCAIPIITGKHKSRQMDEILNEVRSLVSDGTKEFQIIAQELTYYGVDIDGRQHIAELISRMADIPGVEWIRLHYAYPANFPLELLDVMRKKQNVCKYLDIALQHVSDNVLKRMHRNITKKETYELIECIRRKVPGIYIRTTLMVGFPGETEEEFNELIDFVREMRFERMGAFVYSEEENTYSALHYEDDVPEEIKQQRLDRIMTLQQRINAEFEAERIGNIVRVLIDRKEGEYYVGRTEYSSPEVDPEVLIPIVERRLIIGSFYDVKIVDAESFDLFGTVIQN